ncbi:MAG: cytochrome P460 family protein [Hyphomicrobiales bacterium]|nr:cytochrome P460 family protein [Hyphomicrobiales bacterium]
MTFNLVRIQIPALAVTFAGALTLTALFSDNIQAQSAGEHAYKPQHNAKGELLLPKNHSWREWPYVGSMVTPNALNGGEAPFPEHHVTYIDPESWQHYKKTGQFREGTVIAKELTRVRAPDGANKDGSTDEVSGTGYFMGEYSGFEITIKSKKLYPKEPGNWGYYSFGHHPEPYNATAKKQPTEACAACHQASAAEDMVFTQFYPVLRAAKPK